MKRKRPSQDISDQEDPPGPSLSAYLRYQGGMEEGFLAAAKFLVKLGIYWVQDLPYQSQVVPLAAQGKVTRWFWNGVFGELYGSSKETRIAHDFVEVVQWIKGGEEPSTVHDSTVRADRFKSLRSRIPAAYKGVSGLLTNQGAQDFRTGQSYNHTIFFDENVDIHHVFPQDWCKKQGIPASDYDSVINKTPLSARTNRIIGGVAPSTYLKKLNGDFYTYGSDPARTLDGRLASHLIDPAVLREDRFAEFMADMQSKLVALIEEATGKRVIADDRE